MQGLQLQLRLLPLLLQAIGLLPQAIGSLPPRLVPLLLEEVAEGTA